MKANQKDKRSEAGYLRAVGGLVALLLMIIIGVMVFWETSDSITLTGTDANANKNDTTDMASTVFSLLPIIALAAVASLIIGVIIGFGGGGKGI